jgi:hypothetical protein
MDSDLMGYRVSYYSENVLELVVLVAWLCEYTEDAECTLLNGDFHGIWIVSQNAVIKKKKKSWVPVAVILAIQEAEIRRIVVWSQPRQIVRDPIPENLSQK